MNLDRFRELLDAYGADPRRWPEAERGPAIAYLATSREAQAAAARAGALDALLDAAGPPAAPKLDPATLAAKIAQTPRRPVRREWPAHWKVSFGWPGLAGLAAAALAGFLVGWSGLDAGLGLANDGEVAELLSSIAVTEEALW
jgi:hypothetical protein